MPSMVDAPSKERVRCLLAIILIQFAFIYCAVLKSQTNLYGYLLSKSVLDLGGRTNKCLDEEIDTGRNASNDSQCLNLPTIRPSGVFFQDKRVKRVAGPIGTLPSFYFGSNRPMDLPLDKPHFQLIHERFAKTNKTVSFDIGANRGIYTWYTASLGFQEVHSFEINADNFNLLQHGALFNDKVFADRVKLYAMGISDRVGRVEVQDTGFRGFLKEAKGNGSGPILSVSFDCFVQHVQPNLFDDSASIFVKVDVEGFEISVLRGSKGTLLSPSVNVGAWLMEVGPSRWSRAGVSLDVGIAEMMELSSHFSQSFVILRGKSESCPDTLRSVLSDKKPRPLMSKMSMHRVETNEWKQLLQEMNRTGGDCNFWYVNDNHVDARFSQNYR